MRRTAPAVAAALALCCAPASAAATTTWTTCVPARAPHSAARLTAMWRSVGGPGWNGGDGTWSVRLPDGRTAWLFGDTFLGAPAGEAGATFVRNSLVVQSGGCLTTMTSSPHDAAVPGPDADHWYWPAQPLVDHGVLRVLMSAIHRTGPGGWDFAGTGTELATFSLPDLQLRSVVPVGPPGGRVLYGTAGVADGDWTYIYGLRGEGRRLVVARAATGRLDGPWQYYDGTDWTADAHRVAPLAAGISDQATVLHRRGRWVLVSQYPDFSRGVHALVAPGPAGPFHEAGLLTTIPEPPPGACTYNALAHPALSTARRLTLSYNVNGSSYGDPWLYHPRFLRVPVPTSWA